MPSRWFRVAFWLLLALPAALMLLGLQREEVLAMDLLEPSGDWAVRFLVLALLPGPLGAYFGPGALLRGWIAARRNLGLAAFCYAVLHLGLYGLDLGSLRAMADEVGLPGIWTGWLALFLLVPVAATSTNAAMRGLGRSWKSLQRLVYPAVLVAFAHWLLLDWSWAKALVHGAPLMIAWALRLQRRIPFPHGRMT